MPDQTPETPARRTLRQSRLDSARRTTDELIRRNIALARRSDPYASTEEIARRVGVSTEYADEVLHNPG